MQKGHAEATVKTEWFHIHKVKIEMRVCKIKGGPPNLNIYTDLQ